VLCVAKLRPGGHAYYLEVVDTGVEAPGQWLTDGAKELELDGTVAATQLEMVLSGAHPNSGERLGASHDRVRVAGFDLTFCAPKSVSLLHALSESDVSAQVRKGHEEAVRNAVGYVEDHALAVRRGSGRERFPQIVEGVAGAGFLHRTSRALDPHLHTHVVVANLGRAPDSTWSALDARGAYAHASTTAALYHAHLRHELTERLGVEWGPLDRGRADVAGIGREVRGAFSRRSAQIEAHLVERGLVAPGDSRRQSPSQRAVSVASLATRAERDPHLAPESLVAGWKQRAIEAGLSPRLLESTLERAPRATVIDQGATLRAQWVEVEAALGGHERGVARRDVVRVWCSQLARGGNASEVQRAVDGRLSELTAFKGPSGLRDGPGVAERRHAVEPPSLDRAAQAERQRLERFLAERGMSRPLDQSLSLARDSGLGLGL
jgi:conjugative relaxase-like TrwC/TraI family protein